MPSLAPVAPLPEVTVPLNRFILPGYDHYFNGRDDGPAYRRRRYEFWGFSEILPLVRAFLDTCAAARDTEYRYLFTLLGHELAVNAITHTRSGRPAGSFILLVRRRTDGLTLTCHDQGDPDPARRTAPGRHHLADPGPLDPASLTTPSLAEGGRGLALIDTLATDWGDNGHPAGRTVWFHLAY